MFAPVKVRLPAPALVTQNAPLMTLPIAAVEPASTVKAELALKLMPLPSRVQLPKVVAEPKVSPERL